MAGIDVGGRSSRRETNRELALVPFMDALREVKRGEPSPGAPVALAEPAFEVSFAVD